MKYTAGQRRKANNGALVAIIVSWLIGLAAVYLKSQLGVDMPPLVQEAITGLVVGVAVERAVFLSANDPAGTPAAAGSGSGVGTAAILLLVAVASLALFADPARAMASNVNPESLHRGALIAGTIILCGVAFFGGVIRWRGLGACLGVLVVAALLTGCSLAPGGEKVEAAVKAVVETGVADRKAYNDEKAQTLLVLPCDISVGAYFRIDNSVQQEALAMLCSGKRMGEASPALSSFVPAPGTSAEPGAAPPPAAP